MYLKSMTVTDYSTGNTYSYGDMSGSWQSIISNGGKVNGNSAEEPTSTQSAPLITATVDSVPVPWSGTHRETSTFVTPNVWPWVATGSPTATSLPSGWESGGSVSEHCPAPTNIVSTAKPDPPFSQSTSRFISVSSASSSVAFSPSGLETSSSKIVTRHTSTTSTSTTTRHNHSDDVEMETTTTTATHLPSVTANTSSIAPSIGSGTSLYQVPTAFSMSFVCVLLGGIFALL